MVGMEGLMVKEYLIQNTVLVSGLHHSDSLGRPVELSTNSRSSYSRFSADLESTEIFGSIQYSR